jgi:prevent-host-death family protein
VDDEPSIRIPYAHSLADAGFEVAEAAGSTEALRQIEKDRFDLVLTDFVMPKMDGLALLRRVHALLPDLPVIVMLDAPNNQVAVEAAELGARQCLVKPIDHKLLERTAASAVRLSRSQRSTVPASFRNRRGETFVPARITATEAKNKLGRVLDTVIQDGVVFITKHEAPTAALISMEEFNALANATDSRLDDLNGEFDAMLSRMQTAKARAGMKAAFDASPRELGEAAVAVARKRG